MIVLSLFDGMSCGRIALDRLGIKPTKYFASEIDNHAIKVSKANWDDITHIGDVTKVRYERGVLYTSVGEFHVGKIDLLIGGSPCQSFSPLGKGEGLNGKSGLFYEYLRILEEVKSGCDVHWLLENVRMSSDNKRRLDDYLGSSGVPICSSLVSFQKRARYYWASTEVVPPDNRFISFQDYKEVGVIEGVRKLDKSKKSYTHMWQDGGGNNTKLGGCANVTHSDKIYCVTTKQDTCPNSGLVEYEDFCRYLTRRELELAQTVPVGYTDCLSYNQACKVLGNGWTVDVIVHILKQILEVGK